MGNVLNTAYKVVADVIESEENINIEQGTLHVIDDKLKVHLDGDIKEVSTKSYKVYTALLTQSGTDAPVATVLENTLGGDVVWDRGGTGYYIGTLTGAFTLNKTGFTIQPPSNFADTGYFETNDVTVNTVEFTYAKASGGAADNVLLNTLIEIRVYN